MIWITMAFIIVLIADILYLMLFNGLSRDWETEDEEQLEFMKEYRKKKGGDIGDNG